jgi:hypothetical protein
MQSPQYKESGAVYLAGTEGVILRGNRLMYLEGNGIYISGYNRGVRRCTLSCNSHALYTL